MTRAWRWIQPALLGIGVTSLGLMLVNGLVIHRMSETVPLDVYEFLISYTGGFVRRGLIGEILFHLPFLISLHRAEIVVKAICVVALGFAWVYLAASVWRVTASVSSALLVTLQPFLFGFPLLSFEWLRKDTLLVAAFLIALHVGRDASATDTVPGSLLNRRALLVNVVSIVAILSHELYGVALLPILMLVAAGRRCRAGAPLAISAARTIVAFAPSVLVLLLVWFHRGDSTTARQIVDAWTAKGIQSQSWDVAYRDIFSGEPNPAMGIAGVLRQGRSWGWRTYAPWFLYWPVVWLCSGALLIVASTLAQSPDGQDRREGRDAREALTIVLVTALLFVPLFVMAIDWGRWIYVWSCAATALLYSTSGRDLSACVDALRSAVFNGRAPTSPPPRLRIRRLVATGVLTASLFLLPLATMMQEPCCRPTNIVRWCLAYRLLLRGRA